MPQRRRRLLTLRYTSIEELEQSLDPWNARLFIPGEPAEFDGEFVSVEIRLPPEEDRVVVRGMLFPAEGGGALLEIEPRELDRLQTRMAIVRGELTGAAARVTRFGVGELRVAVRHSTGTLSGAIHDVSTGGCFVELDSDATLEPGSEITIELRRGLLRSLALRARVAWTKDEDGLRGVGCTFLPDQEKLIGRFVRAALSD